MVKDSNEGRDRILDCQLPYEQLPDLEATCDTNNDNLENDFAKLMDATPFAITLLQGLNNSTRGGRIPTSSRLDHKDNGDGFMEVFKKPRHSQEASQLRKHLGMCMMYP